MNYRKWNTPDTAAGRSKFASLIPEHVLLLNQLPQNICICQNQENTSLTLQALHNFNKNVPLYSHPLE